MTGKAPSRTFTARAHLPFRLRNAFSDEKADSICKAVHCAAAVD